MRTFFRGALSIGILDLTWDPNRRCSDGTVVRCWSTDHKDTGSNPSKDCEIQSAYLLRNSSLFSSLFRITLFWCRAFSPYSCNIFKNAHVNILSFSSVSWILTKANLKQIYQLYLSFFYVWMAKFKTAVMQCKKKYETPFKSNLLLRTKVWRVRFRYFCL